MPQLQNLILTDRKATPVAHTFTPRDISNGVASVVEGTGTPVGDPRVTLKLVKSANNRYNGTLRLEIPVVQTATINGISVPTVVRKAYGEVRVSFDETSSEAERNDLVGMLADSLGAGKVLVNDTLVKLQNVY